MEDGGPATGGAPPLARRGLQVSRPRCQPPEPRRPLRPLCLHLGHQRGIVHPPLLLASPASTYSTTANNNINNHNSGTVVTAVIATVTVIGSSSSSTASHPIGPMPATPTGAHDPGGPQLGRARRARQPRRGVPVEGSAGPLRRWPLCHGRLEQNGKERKKERKGEWISSFGFRLLHGGSEGGRDNLLPAILSAMWTVASLCAF